MCCFSPPAVFLLFLNSKTQTSREPDGKQTGPLFSQNIRHGGEIINIPPSYLGGSCNLNYTTIFLALDIVVPHLKDFKKCLYKSNIISKQARGSGITRAGCGMDRAVLKRAGGGLLCTSSNRPTVLCCHWKPRQASSASAMMSAAALKIATQSSLAD